MNYRELIDHLIKKNEQIRYTNSVLFEGTPDHIDRLEKRRDFAEKKLQSLEMMYKEAFGPIPTFSSDYSENDVDSAEAFLRKETEHPQILKGGSFFHRVSRKQYHEAAFFFYVLVKDSEYRIKHIIQAKNARERLMAEDLLSDYCKEMCENDSVEGFNTEYTAPSIEKSNLHFCDILTPLEQMNISPGDDMYATVRNHSLIFRDEQSEYLKTPFAYKTEEPFTVLIDYRFDTLRQNDNSLTPDEVVHGIVYQIVRAMRQYTYQVLYFDYQNGGHSLKELQRLSQIEDRNAYWLHEELYPDHVYQLMKTYTSRESISEGIRDITSRIETTNRILEGRGSVIDWNRKMYNNEGILCDEAAIIPQLFLIFDNVNEQLGSDDEQLLKKIMVNSKTCGISLLMVSSHSLQNITNRSERNNETVVERLEREYTRDAGSMHLDVLRWNPGHITFVSNDMTEDDANSRSGLFLACPFALEDEYPAYIESVEKGYKTDAEVDTAFEHAFDLEQDWGSANASKDIEIPLGIDSRKRMVLKPVGNSDAAHVLLAGSTGCGKSTYLHSVISSIIIRYKPTDVQIWLSDYKKIEFKRYFTNTPANITYVGSDNRIDYSLAFIDRIWKEYERRTELFDKITSVEEYRAIHGPDSMPRIIVIIDEFHVLSNHCKEIPEYKQKLGSILREARAVGITMLLSDQTCGVGLGGLSEDGKLQLTGRLCMRTSVDEYNAVFGITNAREMNFQLQPHELLAQVTEKKGGGEQTSVHYERFKTLFVSSEIRDSIAGKSIELYGEPNVTLINSDARSEMDWDTIKSMPIKRGLFGKQGTPVYLGVPTDLTPALRLDFRKDYNQNLMSIGSDPVLQVDIMLSIIESIRHIEEPYRIYIMARDNAELMLATESWFSNMSAADPRVNVVNDDESICATVEQIFAEMNERTMQRDFKDNVYIFWLGLENLYRDFERYPMPENNNMATERRTSRDELNDSFMQLFGDEYAKLTDSGKGKTTRTGNNQKQVYNENAHVTELLNNGSNVEIRSIVFYSQYSLAKETKCAPLKYFENRIAFRMSIDDAIDYLGNSKSLKSADGSLMDENTAVLMNKDGQRRFVPYVTEWEKEMIEKGLMDE